MGNVSSPIFAISRHRIEIDGPGVRTLVGFYNCPLSCAYCINPQCKDIYKCSTWTPLRLNEFVKMDDLYFKASNGGITFGGGEPGMHHDFIREFRKVCDSKWSIAIETTLNFPDYILYSLIESIDYYIIDIKDMSNDIYLRYTKKDNKLVVDNLKFIASNGFQDRCSIKIPCIPNYNTQNDIAISQNIIQSMGFQNIKLFDYVIRKPYD